ncbi:MAG: cytidine deaminase [Blastocatellia bacterium]
MKKLPQRDSGRAKASNPGKIAGETIKRTRAVSDADLLKLAIEARNSAHAPYSRFQVGAALLASDGRIFTGCNIENSSYGLTMCAERVAIFKAASEGVRRILKIAVVADTEGPVSPCGACRQMIWEFSEPDTTVIMADLSSSVEKSKIKALLPRPFDSSSLFRR